MSFQNFPKALRELRQWVVWKFVVRDGKQTKVPFQPNGDHAKSDAPETWCSFDECVQAVSRFDGIGFVFLEGIVGIDLDKCIKDNGALEPWAREIVEQFPSYTELSPSKRGLHIILESDIGKVGRKTGNLECYSHGRFFTVTGDVFEGRSELRDLDIEEWFRDTFPEPKTQLVFELSSYLPSDETIKRVMFKGKNGQKAKDLYTVGDWAKHELKSASEADLSLAGALMFYCGNNVDVADRLFRGSALMREKWDSPRGASTYGRMTLESARAKNVMPWKPKPTYILSNDEKQTTLLIMENICRLMEFDPEISTRFRYNDFSHMVEADHDGEWVNLQDQDILDVQRYISSNYLEFARVSKEMVIDGIKATAFIRKVNPPRDYIESLEWDHEPRLSSWLQKVYGVPDEPVYQAIGSNWMKGLVKRVLCPGCQFDEVLVLESPQGYRKSTSLRVLGSPWHTESTLSTDDKDFYMLLARNIIVEFSEGDIVGRTSARKLKALITKTEDSFRPPYEHGIITFPRGCVFAMTTNDSDYQKDDTGGRRWLPVELRKVADVEWLMQHRDQLYAEAAYRVQVLKETTHEYPLAQLRELQEDRQEGDGYDADIQEWYAERNSIDKEKGFSTSEIFKTVIAQKEDAIMQKDMERRIGSIMRRMGCISKTFKCGKATQRRWVPSA